MRGIRKQSSDTQSSSQPKEKRRLDTKQKKGMLIGGGIFLVAVIALIFVKNLTGGSGADGENVLYADSVGMITGTGLGTQNRFTGVVEAQDTLKLTLADNQKVKQIFVEKGQEVEPGTKLFEYDTEDHEQHQQPEFTDRDTYNGEEECAGQRTAVLYDTDPGTSDGDQAGRVQL